MPPREPKHELRQMRIILVIVITLCVILGGFVAYTLWNGQDRKTTHIPYIPPSSPSTTEESTSSSTAPSGTLSVEWKRGFEKLSDKEVLSFLQKLNPAQKTTQVAVLDVDENAGWGPSFYEPATCAADSNEALCQLHIFRAGTLNSAEASIHNKTLYYFVFPRIEKGEQGEDVPVFAQTSIYGTIDTDGRIHPFAANDSSVAVSLFPAFFNEYYSEALFIPDIALVNTAEDFAVRGDGVLQFKGIYATAGGFARETLDNPTTSQRDFGRYTAASFVKKMLLGDLYYVDGSYHYVFQNGAITRYDLLPYFFSQEVPPDAEKRMYVTGYKTIVQWKAGLESNKNDLFIVGGRVGTVFCSPSILPCTNVVTTTEWFRQDNLILLGTTSRGQEIYELKDAKNNILYQELFTFGFAGRRMMLNPGKEFPYGLDESQKVTDFAEYLSDHSIFFWKDEKGEWRFYQKAGYQSLAECGKPVIYLYPEKTTTVRVQVEPTGGFTKVEPAYPEGGWVVNATPESVLTNTDGKVYPYLFWEGIAYNYEQPKQGFVFSKNQVGSEMRKLLAKAGMNEKETADFMEFWEEKLMVKPYVFVTLVPQSQFNQMAPLTVEPKPDTVIRVFMDYTPLDKPITVQPQRITTPERKGFTVVEWGGALHR